MTLPQRVKWRLALLVLVAGGLASGTWLRSQPEPVDYSAALKISSFEPESRIPSDNVTLENAWRLESENTHFGGYSALIALNEATLLAGSDKARLLRLPVPDKGEGAALMGFMPGRMDAPRQLVDLEALTRDPATNTIWAAYENSQTVERHDPDGTITDRDPQPMRDWPLNGGPETLLRLADGRFLIVAEGADRWFDDTRAGLLYAGDPITARKPVKFRLALPDGLSPVDAGQLPDGRVLLLLRGVVLGLPIRFRSALAILDPATISPAQAAAPQIIARLEGPGLDENFEGLAVVPEDDLAATLYLISDDNFSPFQQTILLRLQWRPESPQDRDGPQTHQGRAEQTARP